MRRVFTGLLIGLLVGLGLMTLVMGAGRGGNRQRVEEQTCVVTAAAATQQFTSASSDSAVDLQAIAERLVHAVPGLVSLRVVDIDQRLLVASTIASDSEGKTLPARLTRDQKDWYDQARELRSNYHSNRSEGAARKDEVLAAAGKGGDICIALPIVFQDEVVGAVFATALPMADVGNDRARNVLWLVLVVAALFVFLVVGARLPGRAARLVLALALLVGALWLYGSFGLSALAGDRVAAETAMRDHALSVRDSLREMPGTSGAMLDPTTWDLDRFGQARGVFDRSGTVDAATVADAYAPALGRFRQSFVALGVIAILLGAWIALGWAQRTGSALVKHNMAYAFVAPAMVGMVLLVFFPFLYGIALSFTNQTLYSVNQPLYEVWTGLQNYISILSDFHIKTTTAAGTSINYQNFYWTLGFTVLWTVSNVTIGVTVGLILALILNTKGLWARPVYRVILILPWAVPNYITALIWRGMFHRQFGVINQVIQIFGGQPVSWFDHWYTSFAAVLTTNAWLSFPFMMVIALGALQSIAADLYEAARVDGAGRWQQFRYITLPSLKPALVPAVILSVIWTFNMFNIIFLVSAGQPAGATEILITDAYKIAFEQYRYGYAAAYSTIIFLILLAYGVWQNRVTRATEGI